MVLDPEPILAFATTIPGAATVGTGLALVAGAVLEWQSRRTIRRAVVRRLRASPAAPERAAPRGDGAPAAATIAKPSKPGLVTRVVEQATVFTRITSPGQIKAARMRLMRAGYYDPNAVAAFFLARAVGAAACGAAAAFGVSTWMPEAVGTGFWTWVLAGGLLGWLIPGFWVNKRIKEISSENRTGFPDFMDLMGVCANAGMSMEAGLERVSRELADMYPHLGVQLQILCLEVRAGRALEEALHALADRLDIAEVRAFATLLQQSKELGSSLSDALRVFSDDMRHKRLSAAEEKAYALPAKLSVPVTACILPVVLFVAILPVIVRMRLGLY